MSTYTYLFVEGQKKYQVFWLKKCLIWRAMLFIHGIRGLLSYYTSCFIDLFHDEAAHMGKRWLFCYSFITRLV